MAFPTSHSHNTGTENRGPTWRGPVRVQAGTDRKAKRTVGGDRIPLGPAVGSIACARSIAVGAGNARCVNLNFVRSPILASSAWCRQTILPALATKVTVHKWRVTLAT